MKLPPKCEFTLHGGKKKFRNFDVTMKVLSYKFT